MASRVIAISKCTVHNPSLSIDCAPLPELEDPKKILLMVEYC